MQLLLVSPVVKVLAARLQALYCSIELILSLIDWRIVEIEGLYGFARGERTTCAHSYDEICRIQMARE